MKFINRKRTWLQALLMLGLVISSLNLPPSYGDAEHVIHSGITIKESHYLLGPGDELQFQVLHEPEYTVDRVIVQPDGKISLPGVGVLNVVNLTVEETIDIIQKRLSRTIINPEATLSLLRPKAATVYLSGAVMRPGMFQISTSNTQQSGITTTGVEPVIRIDFRLSNVLAVAGGVLMNSDLSQVEVRHANDKQTTTVDLWKVLKGQDTSQDIMLNSGDTVYVPVKATTTLDDEDFQVLLRSPIGPKSIPIRVLGQANLPGLYQVDGASPYLSTALAKAGGFAPQASHQNIAIRRFSDESKFNDFYVTPDKFDIMLRPNDIVVIGENKVYKSGRFMQQVAAILSPFQTVAMTGAYSSQVFGIGGWRRVLK